MDPSAPLTSNERPPSKRPPPWTRDESLLALDLYLRQRDSLGGTRRSAEVNGISDALRRLGGLGARYGIAFRSPHAVFRKMENFKALDPSYTTGGRVGLTNHSKIDAAVWEDFGGNPDRAREVAAAIRSLIESKPVELFGGPLPAPSERPSDRMREERAPLPGAPGEPEPDESEDGISAVDPYVAEAPEGRILTRLHVVRERSRSLIEKKKKQALIESGALSCEACDFDYERRYGPHGEGFMEVHHVRPLASLPSGGKSTALSDLALLCASCHRMVHRAPRRLLSVAEVRGMVR